MCGISGFWARDRALPGARDQLARSVEALTHRGPDSNGLWLDGETVGLGHRRLSILDLSAHGYQPMQSARNGRYVISYNGEIYNFAEIRRELEPLGYHFLGTGDTEVMLAAFEQWGMAALQRFLGMFAIALWDRTEQRMYLIRDRLGVKPLYYGWQRGVLWFGSELKALRAFTHWEAQIDRAALGEFFRFGYISAPRSIYACVRKLPPGHWLELGARGEPQIARYWSVLDAPSNEAAANEDRLAEQLEALLVDAFRLRMIADVPVGVFLSGGVDSSIVAAILSQYQDIRTYTIGFNEAAFDESGWSAKVAAHLGTQHTSRVLDLKQARDILPRWADLYDEPFGDSSGIPTYLVSQVASESVKVVLSADGGDELFNGYNLYTSTLARESRLRDIPGWLKRLTANCAGLMPVSAMEQLAAAMPLAGSSAGVLLAGTAARARRLAPILRGHAARATYEATLAQWTDEEIVSLVGVAGAPRSLASSYPGAMAQQMATWDLHHYLPDDILTKVDRATMAASIEGREPLLDHRLVEFAYRLPLTFKRGRLGSKHLLKKVLYKYVPRPFIDRPKQGFGVPVHAWLKGDLSSLLDRYLNRRRIDEAGLLHPGQVERNVKLFRAGCDQYANKVWLLLAFEMWRERWG